MSNWNCTLQVICLSIIIIIIILGKGIFGFSSTFCSLLLFCFITLLIFAAKNFSSISAAQNIPSITKSTSWKKIKKRWKNRPPCPGFSDLAFISIPTCLKRQKQFVVQKMFGCEEFHFARMMTRRNWFAIGCRSGVKTCNPRPLTYQKGRPRKRRLLTNCSSAQICLIFSSERSSLSHCELFW